MNKPNFSKTHILCIVCVQANMKKPQSGFMLNLLHRTQGTTNKGIINRRNYKQNL